MSERPQYHAGVNNSQREIIIIIIIIMIIVDFASPADHRVKLKESEKKEKNLDIVRKLKN